MQVRGWTETRVAQAEVNCDAAVFVGDSEVGQTIAVEVGHRDVLRAIEDLAARVGGGEGRIADWQPCAESAKIIKEQRASRRSVERRGQAEQNKPREESGTEAGRPVPFFPKRKTD